MTTHVPDREREHPSEVLHAFGTLLFVEVHNHLGVALCREGVATCLELPPDLAEVVDLAVEHDGDARVFVAERLMSARQIDNRESPMAKADRSIDEEPLPVGAPVDHGV